MASSGPILLVQTLYDQGCGIVPPGALVSAAANAGYRCAAIIDEGTLRAGPSFLSACHRFGIKGLIGMSVRLSRWGGELPDRPLDVFDLDQRDLARWQQERVGLLAVNRAGYLNLLQIKHLTDQSEGRGVEPSQLVSRSEGLSLIIGFPGSSLSGSPNLSSEDRRREWFVPFLRKWPRVRLFRYPFESAANTSMLALAHHQFPVQITPLAAVWAAFRNQTDCFWGCAAFLQRQGHPPRIEDLPGRIPRADRVTRLLQGVSSAFGAVDGLVAKPFDPYARGGLNFPIYPSPRGTDVSSFLWTLGQESAIATGHIRREGIKDRLVEEFQFLKQTHWPTVWLILWDARRRLGLPPGTLRPTGDWVCTSLFAHLIGLTRIDPVQEGMRFNPDSSARRGPAESRVEMEIPVGWDKEFLAALTDLLGYGRCGVADSESIDTQSLIRSGDRILPLWENLEFPGDRPTVIPPPPVFPREETGQARDSLVLSGINLEQLFAPSVTGYPSLDCREEDALLTGALALQMERIPSLALSAAALYRGSPAEGPRPKEARESITSWIETHRGAIFRDRGYADDSGRLEVLGYSSCLLRLLTLPGSAGYRPLLWRWIYSTAPTRIGELADLLALAWHWTHWTRQETRRLIAVQRDHPLLSEGGMPPWWEEWSKFTAESGLDLKTCGDLGAALESASQATGGWLLFREQIHQVGKAALGLSPAETDIWLSSEDFAPKGTMPASRIWQRGVREAFQQFLGNPNPPPFRIEFLKKAEVLLMISDAFAEDPAAVVALMSYVQPEESEERHEVYSLVQERGIRLSLPKVEIDGRYDRSLSTVSLQLGTMNILGVGPQIAAELESPLVGAKEALTGAVALRHLFSAPSADCCESWEEWLASWSDHRLSHHLLLKLIRLGIFDRFGDDREALAASLRSLHLSTTVEGTRLTQQTLFSLRTTVGDLQPFNPHDPGEIEAKRPSVLADRRTGAVGPHAGDLEFELLRVGITESPLQAFEDWFYEEWFADQPVSDCPPGLKMGYLHEVDVFALPPEPTQEEPGLLSSLSFLFFTPQGAVRIWDETGKVLGLLPVTVPDPLRLDGHRLHLRGPRSLLCDTRPLPHSGHVFPSVRLQECEGPAQLEEAFETWDGIEVTLFESSGDLLERTSKLLRWFRGRTRTVPVSFSCGARLLRRSGVRRLISRLGDPQVVPSRVLLHRLRLLPGVESVRVIRRQEDLFV